MLREPIGVQNFFTFEQTGQPPISTEILDQNAKSYANQGPAIIAAEKVTLPTNFGTEYPSWGTQSAINAVQNLPSLVQTIQNQPILAAQRQVELSKASQNLDYLTHLHDSGLYPYVAEMPGVKPYPVNTSAAAYNLGQNPLTNPNALYQTKGQNFAGANTPLVTTNDQGGGQRGTQNGNQNGSQQRQQQPAYQANPATIAPAAPAPSMSINAGSGGSPGTGGMNLGASTAPAASPSYDAGAYRSAIAGQTGNLSASLNSSGPAISTFPNVAGNGQPAAPSLSLASGNPYVTETSSPQPLDVPQRTHYSPQEALDWYKQNIGTNAVHARQEFDPSTGYPTNRNLVTLKDGSIQPIHSAFISANPGTGDWQSDPATGNSTNPALAANPNAQALAQGMPQQAIIAQGTPLTASNDQMAGTRSDVPQYANAPWLNRPSGMPTPVPTPTPQLPSAPTAKPQTYQPPSPEGDPSSNGYWMGHFGMSAQEFQQRMNDPKYAQVVGTGTPNASGIPSKKVQVTGLDGTKYNAYIDPGDGRPYVVQSPTLWSEHRDYLDGTSKDITNTPGEAAEAEMARVATKWGTYSGAWTQLTPVQKEAAARLGFAQENTTVNDGFSKNLQNQGTVINRAIELQNQLEGLTSTEDPDGSKARNWLAINANPPNKS
jgi:hypothetical protein